MKLKIATIFYRKYKVTNQIHTEISLSYDTHHFIPANQSISLKSILNIGNLKKVVWIKTFSNYGNALRGI